MYETVFNIIYQFSLKMGILGLIRENMITIKYFLIFLAVLLLFLGFKVFRGIFSFQVFVAIAIFCCFIMENKTDWGSIVTTFSVVGVIVAFIAYRWVKLGGFCISTIISGIIIWSLTRYMPVTIIGSALVGILFTQFPVIIIIATTSLYGLFYIFDVFYNNVFAKENSIYLIIIIGIVGFLFQIATNRKQTIFKKTCPDKVRYYFEKKKRKKGKSK